ncbi:hypothetical protein GCM10019016_070000 [Streptomyces prasinosporus]|uniref:Uncharacterized protein n=1 Tax=Streptomyces prasinosporus TaxID=68256 RepID=A0ABP6TYR6_9ACTN
MPAEVATARVRAVTEVRAARRRGDIRRRLGCMRDLRSTRQPPFAGCALPITLRHQAYGRSPEGPIGGRARESTGKRV